MRRTLSGPVGLVLAILTSIAIIVGLWFGYANRQANARDDAQTQTAQIQAETEAYQGYLDQISAGGGDPLGDLYTRVQLIDGLLPSEVDEGAVTSALNSEVPAAGLTGFKVTKSKAVERDHQDFTVTADGSYAAITAWLNSVQTRSQLVTVQAVDLKPSVVEANLDGTTPAAGDGFTVTATLRYWMADQPPLQAVTSQVAPVAVPAAP